MTKQLRLIAKVKREENRMIAKIKTLERDRNTRFYEHEKTVSMMVQKKQYSLEVAEDVTKNSSDSNFLELYPDMEIADWSRLYHRLTAACHAWGLSRVMMMKTSTWANLNWKASGRYFESFRQIPVYAANCKHCCSSYTQWSCSGRLHDLEK